MSTLGMFKELVNGASGNDAGMGSLIQRMVYKSRASELRDNILENYFDGKTLTEKEVQFLALTSQELNKFIDKEQYQRFVNRFSSDFINQLEINIAEQILSDYYDTRQVVFNKREQFLNNWNTKLKTKIAMASGSHQSSKSRAELELNRQKQAMIKKKVITQFFGGFSNGSRFVSSEARNNSKSLHSSSTAGWQKSSVERLNDSSGVRKQRSGSVPRVYKVHEKMNKVTRSSLYGDVSDVWYYKARHPQSKLVPDFASGSLANHKKVAEDQMDKRVRSQEVKLKGQKTRFFFTYSAGPEGVKKLERRCGILNKRKAALLIQKCWRGYKARKAVRPLRLRLIETNYYNSISSPQKNIQFSPIEIPSLVRSSSSAKIMRRVTFQEKETGDMKGSRNSGKPVESLGSDEVNHHLLMKKKSVVKKPLKIVGEKSIATIKLNETSGNKKNEELLNQEAKFRDMVASNRIKDLEKISPFHLKNFINSMDQQGMFPIEYAIQFDSVEMTSFLIENGFSAIKCQMEDNRVFEIATSAKSFKVVLELFPRLRNISSRY